MQVITFLNQKGGTGKSTFATHIAAGLAMQGARVVLMDADPQGNATDMMQVRKRGALYNLVVRPEEPEAQWQQCLEVVDPAVYSPDGLDATGQLFVVPSNVETRNIPNSIPNSAIFRTRFNELKNAVNFIIVDTSPTPSLLHGALLAASDYVLIPTQLEKHSAFDGLSSAISHAKEVSSAVEQAGISGVKVLGIAPNMYRSNTGAHNAVLEDLHEHYGNLVMPPVRQAIVFAEAALVGKLVFAHAPNSSSADELWALVTYINGVAA